MSKKTKKKSLTLNYRLTITLAIIIVLTLLVGLAISFRANFMVDQIIAEAKEAARPADLEIISIVDSSCEDCFSLSALIDGIKKMNVNISQEQVLQLSDQEAKNFISKFSIAKAPVLIIKGEVKKDKTLADYLGKIGKIEDDTFILTQVAAPYVATSTGEIKGIVEFTMLTDRDCAECYDVTVHEKILGNFGINSKYGKITETDFPDGKELIKKYNITLAPTIVITGDIDAYPTLKQVWSNVGTVEDDGTYIFRNGVKQMGIYKDLSTGEVVKPDKQKP